MTEEQKLKKAIELHSGLYDKGTPLISDADFDEMVREYNEVTGGGNKAVVSPVVVGSPVPEGSPKVAHPTVMLSLNNAFNQIDRAEAWHAILRHAPGGDAYADMKIDGMAIRLEYENGIFVSASSRGNGTIGENVTKNALRIADIPLRLKDEVSGRISIVGEAYIPNSSFTLLNADREEAGEDIYTSPRNSAAGGMRHSDPNEVTKRGIRFFAYGVLHSDRPRGFSYHSEVMEWLSLMGFKIVEHGIAGLATESDIERAFEKLEVKRHEVDYDCDGVVVKLNSLPAREKLGAGRTAPNWAYACKFVPSAERTILKNVTFPIGRTGAVTPVGEVEAVVIGDVTVTSVTLHNKDIIDNLDLRIGDNILVKRAGDVIPAVEQVFVDERNGNEQRVVFPTRCPVCESILIRPPGEARIYCPNTLLCKGQLQRGLEHFVGQDYMALKGVGPAAIKQLVDKEMITEIADLYRLTWDDVVSLAGYGDKKAENLLEEILASKQRPLQKLLAALGIREVGRSASEALVGHFGTLDAILDATHDEERPDEGYGPKLMEAYNAVRSLEGFGPKMAESFCNYMQNPNNRQQLLALKELGVGIASSPTTPSADTDSENKPLAGLHICATGKLQGYTRGGISARIQELGGNVQSSVSGKTDVLIAGEKAGSKLAKARTLGVLVVNEYEFDDYCRNGEMQRMCAGR